MTWQPTEELKRSWTMQAHVAHSTKIQRILHDHEQGFYSNVQAALEDIKLASRDLIITLFQIQEDPQALFEEFRQESADHLRDNLNEQEV